MRARSAVPASISARTGGARHLHGERHCAGCPLDLAERAYDQLSRSVTVEAAPVLLRNDPNTQSATDERGALRPAIHVRGDLVERILERRVRHRELRKHLRAEYARADAAEATQRAEAVAGSSCGRNRSTPVGLDAELIRGELVRRRPGDELDRVVGPLLVERLELRDGLAPRQPTDVDAGDLGSGRELAPRSGEGEADEDSESCDGHNHTDDDRGAWASASASAAARCVER